MKLKLCERFLLKHNTTNKMFLTFPPLHMYGSVPAPIMTCQCFLSSAISVVIWFLVISSFTRSPHLSFGLPRIRFPSTVICNIFLVASSLSHLCTCPNHLNLFSGELCHCVRIQCIYMCLFLVFPLAHRSMCISFVCSFLYSFFLPAQHSAPYTMAAFIAVMYTLYTTNVLMITYVRLYPIFFSNYNNKWFDLFTT